MLNSPTNVFDQQTGSGRTAGLPWQVDQNPGLRHIWLFCVILLPFLCVTIRLIQLQCLLPDAFVKAFHRTTEVLEPIPSRDGRILASDGRILALDIERFSVSMHYRWLEEPANANWLRQQALSRLGRWQRRNRTLVEAAEQHVLEQRRQMWRQLATLTGISPEELTKERARIQKRVERIVDFVNRSRQRRNDTPADSVPPDLADAPWWKVARYVVMSSLTTPPQRSSHEPLVIKEERDYHLILDNITLHMAAEIESHPQLYPGLRINMTTQREYPQGPVAAHIIGSRTRITQVQLEARRKQFPQGDPLNYQPGDRIGQTGVERSFDRYLRGIRGLRKIVRNRRGEVVQTEIIRKPRIGRDVELTLDWPLQQGAEQLLDEAIDPLDAGDGRTVPRGGCLVALDVHTGEVLAAASAPRFDLNLLIDPEPQVWELLLKDQRRPFFPRATQMALPPGSVFKTLTAIALLANGTVDPDEELYCRGYLERPDQYRCYIYTHYGHGHANVTLNDAICQSCNVYFFSAADRMGPAAICHWAQRFGFGQPTGIDLPGENGGNVPIPGPTASDSRTPWYRGDTRGLAIGQSRLTTTPLQIARMMAAIANGGYLLTPRVVQTAGPDSRSRSAEDESRRRAWVSVPQPRRIPGLSREALQRVRKGLEQVVSNPRGTGYKRVRLKEIAIAGKTGTAETGRGRRDHAWFAGYVPANNPKVAFAVVLEHGGSGGSVAGPIARQFVQLMLEQGLLHSAQLSMR